MNLCASRRRNRRCRDERSGYFAGAATGGISSDRKWREYVFFCARIRGAVAGGSPPVELSVRQNADTKFTAIFPHGEKITQEQFDAAAAERMENTGCIAGAYELDLDAQTLSALNIMDGWKVYAMQDVAEAAAQAYQEAEMSEDDRWRIFLDRLDGQELTTPSRLTARNFYFEDSIEAMDDRTLNFYIVPCFNVDEVFGTFVETDENDHALNIYANYDMQRQQVCDTLEMTLYGSGIDDQSLTYHLNAAEKEVLREKMDAYCMQREHKPLEQLCQEILQEQDAPTQEMQL